MIARSLLVGLAIVGGACSDHADKPQIQRDKERPRRIIEPPSGTVRPLPPHAIRAEGVGPYKLGERLDQTIEQLPSSPRIAVYDIANLVHRSLIRAEDDTVLIGAPEPSGTATFVAVINGDVARTESGCHVGSSRAEIDKALGPPLVEPEHAHDPRLVVPSSLHNLRIIVEGDKARAIVVLTDAARPPAELPPCPRPTAAGLTFGACLLGSGPGEMVDVTEDDIAVRGADSEKPAIVLRVPNLVFAAALRNVVDNRDELVAITRSDEPAQRTWQLTVFHMEANRLVRAVEPTVIYQLSSTNARWIGAELREVELYLELSSRAEAIDVGGLLTVKAAGKIRDVVTISTVTVPRRRGKPLVEPTDAGVPNPGGSEAIDAGSAVEDVRKGRP